MCWCGKKKGHFGPHQNRPNVKPGPKKGAKYKRRKQPVTKVCAQCGRQFTGLLARGRYCSRKCRDAAGYQRKKNKKG